MNIENNKICTQCNLFKNNFYIINKITETVDKKCKDCRKLNSAKHYANNKQEYKAYHKQYREDNLEYKKEVDKLYYLSHTDTIKDRTSKYAKAHRAEINTWGTYISTQRYL